MTWDQFVDDQWLKQKTQDQVINDSMKYTEDITVEEEIGSAIQQLIGSLNIITDQGSIQRI